jgi:hypothetical protein
VRLHIYGSLLAAWSPRKTEKREKADEGCLSAWLTDGFNVGKVCLIRA